MCGERGGIFGVPHVLCGRRLPAAFREKCVRLACRRHSCLFYHISEFGHLTLWDRKQVWKILENILSKLTASYRHIIWTGQDWSQTCWLTTFAGVKWLKSWLDPCYLCVNLLLRFPCRVQKRWIRVNYSLNRLYLIVNGGFTLFPVISSVGSGSEKCDAENW